MIGLARGSVQLEPYKSEWVIIFVEEREALLSQISDHVIAVEHVGSTSIPEMSAKPIIDIAAAVLRLEDVKKCFRPLEAADYEYRGEVKPGDHLFVKGSPSKRTVYLHIAEYGSRIWEDFLLFRDYLRRHKDVAQEYASLKRERAERYEKNRDSYTKSKADFIESILERARHDPGLNSTGRCTDG
jgi:GrpB-like predicted nucleotidyltransferase (UPF0157 family)